MHDANAEHEPDRAIERIDRQEMDASTHTRPAGQKMR
jgi:hypothetical protein